MRLQAGVRPSFEHPRHCVGSAQGWERVIAESNDQDGVPHSSSATQALTSPWMFINYRGEHVMDTISCADDARIALPKVSLTLFLAYRPSQRCTAFTPS